MISDETEVLTLLQILSQIRQNERIATNLANEYISIEPKGILQSIKRFIRGENRKDNLSAVNTIFQRGFDLLQNKIHLDEKVEHFLQHMYNAIQGVANLRSTYENDSITLAKIDVTLQMVSRKLELMRERIRSKSQIQVNLN